MNDHERQLHEAFARYELSRGKRKCTVCGQYFFPRNMIRHQKACLRRKRQEAKRG